MANSKTTGFFKKYWWIFLIIIAIIIFFWLRKKKKSKVTMPIPVPDTNISTTYNVDEGMTLYVGVDAVNEVASLQTLLKVLSPELVVDGLFGQNTLEAVRSAMNDNSLTEITIAELRAYLEPSGNL